MLRRPFESGLAAAIGMVKQSATRLALSQRRAQDVEGELFLEPLAHRAGHDPPGEQVQDHRQVQPALQRPQIGDIGDPTEVRPRSRSST